MARNILHCDMNNFYASVECMLNPALKEYPVAVCGSVEERHGIVLAKNYKAKAFDVKTGDTVWQAQQKCRDLVIVPPHYEEYIKYSKLARSVYERYTDQVEPYGMDECWLDITGTGSLFGSPVEVANKIRETIKFELGLTISVGVSFNKIFAKLGSDMKKPDAVTVIPKDTFREKIWKLPSADLLGVGRATQRTLDSYGIRTIGALAQTDPEFLRSVLGKNGVALWNYANGNDLSLVAKKDFVSPIKSVGHGITTVADLEKPEQVWPVFLELTQDIGHKLRVHGLSAEGVAIHIRDMCCGWVIADLSREKHSINLFRHRNLREVEMMNRLSDEWFTSKSEKVPLWHKIALSIDEMYVYTGIGRETIRELTKQPEAKQFTLKIGKRTLIKRKQFEEYLDQMCSI